MFSENHRLITATALAAKYFKHPYVSGAITEASLTNEAVCEFEILTRLIEKPNQLRLIPSNSKQRFPPHEVGRA